MKISGFVLSLILVSSLSLKAQDRNDSIKNGKYVFYSKEVRHIDAYYKNQKRHRIWTWYLPDGGIDKKIKYRKGKRLWVIYYEKNKPWIKIDRYGKRRIIRPCKCRERDMPGG
ncbi:MAG: hypothetical protein H6605_04740 [Flavobacteriales bacterium]|nr:hypothetical protein [Flavobacteriales bacterium]